MQIKFETEYNLQGLTEMAKALRKTVRKKRSKRSHILGWIIVAFSFLLVTAAESPLSIREKVILAVGAVVAVTLIFEDRLNGFIARKRMLKGTEKSVVVFDAENTEIFVSRTDVGKSEFYYRNIVTVAETKKYFVFILSANHAQLYDKANLTGGTVDQFRQFISEKTDKAVVFVK